MPELPEILIMSNFINNVSKNKTFCKIYDVAKGDIPSEYLSSTFTISSDSSGKELKIYLKFDDKIVPIYVFMGMSGNWKYVDTKNWNDTKYIRLRLDDSSGKSLLLFGGYMGPKYKIGEKFTGVERGPDPIKEFDRFKEKILNNLNEKDFNKPIPEVMLNQKYFNGIGAYLLSEILGRLDIDPFINFNNLNEIQIKSILDMSVKCCIESYQHGGGELKDWNNPFGFSDIKNWILYYGNKDICIRNKFGKRNIWIQKKFM